MSDSSSTLRLILLNGPPRSGKDFAGELIRASVHRTVAVRKFAAVVKDRCHAAYGLQCSTGYFESTKDEPSAAFLGRTPREAYIAFSEKFYKPLHGKDVFGRLLAERMAVEHPSVLFVVTDSGFREESEVLVAQNRPDRSLLIRLHRDGHDFSNDSRGYIDLSDLGVRCVDVTNPGTPRGLAAELGRAMEAGR